MKILRSTLRTAALVSTLAFLSHAAASPAVDPVAAQLASRGTIALASAGPYVELGTYQIQVSAKLGRPSRQLADGLWLYEDFNIDNSRASGALVVRFTRGRVSELSLVTPAVALALSTPKTPAAQVLVAAQR